MLVIESLPEVLHSFIGWSILGAACCTANH